MPVVKVRLAGLTVPSVVSLEVTPILTLAVGCELSTTVKVAVPPASVVFPEIADIVIAKESLSIFRADTGEGVRPL